jgi:uncharacterized repeat protein (TIGR02543 family)
MKINISKKIGCIVLSTLITVSVLLSNFVDVVPDAVNTVHADSVHTEHEGEDSDGTCHAGWTAWTKEDELPSDPGSYFLTKDVTLSSRWNVPEGTTNLCLNGHSITAAGNFIAIRVNSSNNETVTLNLYDESGNTGIITHAENAKESGVYVAGSGASFNMYGGKITGNTARYGGGLKVQTHGEATIYGGEISGNTATMSAGGVSVALGTLTIYGGEISGNTAVRIGGGVHVDDNSTFDMSGGKVTGNTADTDGNNVYINPNCTFTPSGTAVIDGGLYSEDYTTVCFYKNDPNDATDEMTSQIIKKGEDVKLSPNAFTREGYDFTGWNTKADGTGQAYADEDEVNVSSYEGLTLYAQWKLAKYTIKFLDEDGKELSSTEYEYGTKAADIVKPADPTKAPTAQYTYKFSGWTPEIADVTGDETYTATYSSSVNEYTITFVNEDGTVLQSGKVAYGDTPVFTGTTPDKKADAQYTYTFSGWTPEIADVTGDETYTATYSSSVNEYTITFVNEDGTVLQSGKVAYGDTPVFTGTTPVKAETDKYTYEFSGWTPEITKVTGDATYTAVFKATEKPAPATYTVTFETNGGSVVASQTVADGSKATKPADPTREGYTFGGWYQDATCNVAFDFDTAITADVTLYAKWIKIVETVFYTVVEGANGTCTKGSDYTIKVDRSVDNNTCLDHLVGVKIDDAELVRDTDYTATSGSAIITIKAAVLSKLSVGSHTITVLFDDGQAETTVTIKAASNNNNNSTDTTTKPKVVSPATGEIVGAPLWAGLFVIFTAGAYFSFVTIQKRRKSAQR